MKLTDLYGAQAKWNGFCHCESAKRPFRSTSRWLLTGSRKKYAFGKETKQQTIVWLGPSNGDCVRIYKDRIYYVLKALFYLNSPGWLFSFWIPEFLSTYLLSQLFDSHTAQPILAQFRPKKIKGINTRILFFLLKIKFSGVFLQKKSTNYGWALLWYMNEIRFKETISGEVI